MQKFAQGTDSSVDTYFGLCTYPGHGLQHRIDLKVIDGFLNFRQNSRRNACTLYLYWCLFLCSPSGESQAIICQCIAQTSLAHWVQPSILYLQFTLITCTAHISSLYKALYCTLLHTHQYTNYLVFLSHFILLTWYQSHSSNFLAPVDISGIFSLPSSSSKSHCQKRVTAVTPTAPKTLRFRQFC